LVLTCVDVLLQNIKIFIRFSNPRSTKVLYLKLVN